MLVCPVVRFNKSKSIRLVSRKLGGRYQESMYLVNWVIASEYHCAVGLRNAIACLSGRLFWFSACSVGWDNKVMPLCSDGYWF